MSIRLTLYVWPSSHFHSTGAMASDSDIVRLTSSGSVSHTVVPSSTRPALGTTPARSRIASTSVVFPHPPWPTMATLRILSVDGLIKLMTPDWLCPLVVPLGSALY